MIVEELVQKIGLNIDGAAFERAEKMFAGMRGLMFGLVSVGAAAAASIGLMVDKTAEYAFEIRKASAQTGIGAREMQELSHAGSMVGLSTEEIAHSMVHFSRTIREATLGSAGARVALGQLGIHTHQADGQVRPLGDLLGDIAAKFQKMPDGATKAALAMQLFSRGGARMIPMLNMGKDGLAKLRQEAEDLGIVLDEKALKAAKEFTFSQQRLKGAVDGLIHSIGGPLLEPMRKNLDAMTNWLKANRQIIASKIDQFVQNFGKAIQFAAKHTEVLKFALETLAVLMGFQLIGNIIGAVTALGSMADMLKKVAAWAGLIELEGAAAVLPWILLAAVLVLVADDIKTFFEGGDSMIGRYGQRWTRFLDNLLKPREGDNWLERTFKGALSVLTDLEGTWNRLVKSWNSGHFFGNSRIGQWLTNTTTTDETNLPIAQQEANMRARGEASAGGKQVDPNHVFGAGASPEATVAARDPWMDAVDRKLSVGKVESTVHVNVPSTNATAKEIGNAVKEAQNDFWQEILNAALPAAQ